MLPALLLMSCRTPLTALQNSSADSVFVVEKVRDTVIVVQADSSLVKALIECDSLGRAHLTEITELRSGQHVRAPTLSMRDNLITSASYMDHIVIPIQLKESIIKSSKAQVITRIVEVNRLTTWQSFWVIFGKCTAGLIAISALLLIAKKWLIK